VKGAQCNKSLIAVDHRSQFPLSLKAKEQEQMVEKLNRRDFLRLSALAAAGVTVAACAKTAEPTQEVAPTATQATTTEKEAATATPMPEAGPSAQQAPPVMDQVAAGALPPLEERLPTEPFVVEPIEQVGRYGGDQTMGTLGVADGAIFTRFTKYENLARWNVEWTDVVPDIATGWEVQDEGATFIFSLTASHTPQTTFSSGTKSSRTPT
jgi:ABC-type transport system substrate-binding protein